MSLAERVLHRINSSLTSIDGDAVDQFWYGLRSDPRYADLRRIGLPLPVTLRCAKGTLVPPHLKF